MTLKQKTISLVLIFLVGIGLFFWQAGQDYQIQVFERCLENEYNIGFQDGVDAIEQGYCEGYSQGRSDEKYQPEINRCK